MDFKSFIDLLLKLFRDWRLIVTVIVVIIIINFACRIVNYRKKPKKSKKPKIISAAPAPEQSGEAKPAPGAQTEEKTEEAPKK